MMERREIGTTGVRLSVVGAGSAQLQMLPREQAVAALQRAFERHINWVHTAPDYGGVESWIAEAIARAGAEVSVAAQSPAYLALFDAYFGHALRVFGRGRPLDLYGLNCIDDIERIGENVWGAGGMVDQLLRRKSAGDVRAVFCTTHGSPSYIERLLRSAAFDAIMVAWNPLGFHQLTYNAARDGREFERLEETRARIFPLAAELGVSLLVMKPLGGGLLTRGKAFVPAWWPAGEAEISAAELLKFALGQPGVTAVVPGIASIEEAEEDAAAGVAPLALSPARAAVIASRIAAMRLSLCSRCGECETTCSRHLPVSSMFRDAYIWSYGNETFMASDEENYFRLHPSDVVACATCDLRSCLCPQGLDVPRQLSAAHAQVQALRARGVHPGPLEALDQRLVRGAHQVIVVSRDVPDAAAPGSRVVSRFILENAGDTMWACREHDARRATAVAVLVNGTMTACEPLRQNICAEARAPIAVHFQAPAAAGAHAIAFALMPHPDGAAHARTVFHTTSLQVA